MRDSLQIKLEDLRQDQLKELFLILEEVFSTLEIDFYVLGAVHGIPGMQKGIEHQEQLGILTSLCMCFPGSSIRKHWTCW